MEMIFKTIEDQTSLSHSLSLSVACGKTVPALRSAMASGARVFGGGGGGGAGGGGGEREKEGE